MISRVWEATTAKRMQIDPYCHQQKCSPLNVVSSDIRVMQIFAGVREIWGVKQESGHLTCQCCRAFTLALARLSCNKTVQSILIKTVNIKLCPSQFCFDLPSAVIERHEKKFRDSFKCNGYDWL